MLLERVRHAIALKPFQTELVGASPKQRLELRIAVQRFRHVIELGADTLAAGIIMVGLMMPQLFTARLPFGNEPVGARRSIEPVSLLGAHRRDRTRGAPARRFVGKGSLASECRRQIFRAAGLQSIDVARRALKGIPLMTNGR